MAVRPIDANELYRIEKLLDTDIVRQDKVALNLLEQVLYDIQHVPTLTPPNEPMTLEQLREMDGKPVWCEWLLDEDRETGHGAWFIVVVGKYGLELKKPLDFGCHVCKNENYGTGWLAYRRPPEGEEDA